MIIYQLLLAVLFPLIVMVFVFFTAMAASACFVLVAFVQYLRTLSGKTLFTIGGVRLPVAPSISSSTTQGA